MVGELRAASFNVLNYFITIAGSRGGVAGAAEVVPNGETAVLNSESFANGRTGSPKNRPALAQVFLDRDTGGRFTMVVNHVKSKGSGCGAGDDDPAGLQGSCNGTHVSDGQWGYLDHALASACN